MRSHRYSVLFVALLVGGCSSDPARATDTLPDDTVPDAAAPAVDASIVDGSTSDAEPPPVPFPPGVPTCAIGPDDPRRQHVETLCDGVDNDCDGLVDVLLPVDANRCATGQAGACGDGYATCTGTVRTCLGPGPTPEVLDGVDNDCDGTVDVVPAASVTPRAMLLVPNYLWSDARIFVDSVTSALDQRGVPYDRPGQGADWAASVASLPYYSMAIIPGYFVGDDLTASDREKLEAFVSGGGILVVLKPLGSPGSQGLALAGLASSAQSRAVTSLVLDGAPAIPTSAFDTLEERHLLVASNPAVASVESYVFQPSAGTTVIARALEGSAAVGAGITRRALGRGAVYALGHDLTSFQHSRCLVNCFEPAGDTLGMFLRDAFRESAKGHSVLLHTVPGVEDSVLLLTHDSDIFELDDGGSNNGIPGTLQMAQMQVARGVRGTYFVSTSYDENGFDSTIPAELCQLGMCPLGAHSIRHSLGFETQARGTCTETYATYRPGDAETLCGEIRVNKEILFSSAGHHPRIFRSPYLLVHPNQFDVLADEGFVADSSYLVGGLKYNLPLATATTGVNQEIFHHRPLYELPIAGEDGLLLEVDGKIVRRELEPDLLPTFVSLWSRTLLLNHANQAYTTVLVHPTAGSPTSTVGAKVQGAAALLAVAANEGTRVDTMDAIADYWRAREGVTVYARYGEAGYSGTLFTGARPIRRLTLEFGDAVSSFTCAACGPVQRVGKRVVIEGPLDAHRAFVFTAKPGL